jgi:hypothetical protein
MRLLEKSPDARYPSADALIAALEAALADEGVLATPVPLPVAISAPAAIRAPAALEPALPMVSAAPRAPARGRLAYAAAGVFAIATLGFALWWSPFAAPDPTSSSEVAAPSAVAVAVAVAVIPSTEATLLASSSPPPSAPPVAAAAPAPAVPAVDPVARALLRNAVAARDFKHGIEPFFTLVEHDPTAFHDPALATSARDLAVTLALVASEDTDRLFEALASRVGSDGVDVLYEIVRTRGGSKAAARAESLLVRSDVNARATPALQITYALRAAPCAEKLALLDRAAQVGDTRTLVVMETTVKSCFSRNQALEDTIKSLRQRLSQRPTP